ncbi:MAG: metallophosphoesterase [Ignavibacteriales bacterium]|nr:metallophosphoesterase [Ignavibacteriales bacterium]
MAVFFSIFFILYSLINYYIFIRGWQAISAITFLKPFYIFTFLLFAFGYLAAKFLHSFLPHLIYDLFLWVGSFWFAFILYLTLFILFIDLARIANYYLGIFPTFINSNYELSKQIAAAVVLFLSSTIILIGFINSTNFKVKNLYLNVDGKNVNLNQLNIVMLSDIHLSPLNGESFLKQIVEKVNELNADIILIAGDIVDDKPHILTQRGIGKSLNRFKSKYGVYASTGNHEYINGGEESVKYLTANGIKVMRDSSEVVNNSFILVGREDVSKQNFTQKRRKSLSEILNSSTENLPVILLDHTPYKLKEAQDNRIALQLSGHTHNGQMFPINLITNLIYELSWGYMKKGSTHYYVSSGVGSWGPRVKLASDAEIVNIKLNFTN